MFQFLIVICQHHVEIKCFDELASKAVIFALMYYTLSCYVCDFDETKIFGTTPVLVHLRCSLGFHWKFNQFPYFLVIGFAIDVPRAKH